MLTLVCCVIEHMSPRYVIIHMNLRLKKNKQTNIADNTDSHWYGVSLGIYESKISNHSDEFVVKNISDNTDTGVVCLWAHESKICD